MGWGADGGELRGVKVWFAGKDSNPHAVERPAIYGLGGRARTCDFLIPSQALYRLSYTQERLR